MNRNSGESIRVKNNSMLKISIDDITVAIQKDVHAAMQQKGVENFFEFLGDALCVETNTARGLMKKGNWTVAHLMTIKKRINAVHLREVLTKEFSRTEG